MSTLLALAGTGLSAVAVAHAGSWFLLSALALPRPRRPRAAGRSWRMAVIVPAHNEADVIAETLESLAADAYIPRPEVVVVADNCDDDTATVARGLGATVLERFDAERRGKPHALDFGLAAIEAREAPPEAYIILDADTVVAPGFFQALADTLDGGAAVVQAQYRAAVGVEAGPRLRALAFSLVHYARPLGAARLGLGMGLKGNGMAFRRELLAGGMPGSGITEDAAATLELASRGVAARFAPHAVVTGRMAPSYAAARVQDRRWEGGRLSLSPRALSVAVRALARGHWSAAGSAMDVAALPLTLAGVLCGAGLALALAGEGSLPLAVTAFGLLVAYPLTGWAAAGVPVRELAVLARAPRFILHKLSALASLALHGVPRTWERTERGGRA